MISAAHIGYIGVGGTMACFASATAAIAENTLTTAAGRILGFRRVDLVEISDNASWSSLIAIAAMAESLGETDSEYMIRVGILTSSVIIGSYLGARLFPFDDIPADRIEHRINWFIKGVVAAAPICILSVPMGAPVGSIIATFLVANSVANLSNQTPILTI